MCKVYKFVFMKHMNEEAEKHPKQEFQVERLAFFSDAVFAIAITLLIIEFRVPHISKESSLQEVLHQLAELKLELASLLATYLLIASYWIRHHSLYKYIHDYNKHIVIANMAALLPIIFLPFSTAFAAQCLKNAQTVTLGLQVFFLNHFAAGLTIFALYWLGTVRHKHLSHDVPATEKISFYEQTLLTPMIFLALFVATLFTADLNNILGVMVVCATLRFTSTSFLKKRSRQKATA